MEGYRLRIGTQDLRILSCHNNIWYTCSSSYFVANPAIMRTLLNPEYSAWGQFTTFSRSASYAWIHLKYFTYSTFLNYLPYTTSLTLLDKSNLTNLTISLKSLFYFIITTNSFLFTSLKGICISIYKVLNLWKLKNLVSVQCICLIW